MKSERETVREKSQELFDQTCKESFDNWQSLMIKAGEEKRSNLNGLEDSELEGRKKGVVDGVCRNTYAKIALPQRTCPAHPPPGSTSFSLMMTSCTMTVGLFTETVAEVRDMFINTMRDATRDIARVVAFQNSPALATNFIN